MLQRSSVAPYFINLPVPCRSLAVTTVSMSVRQAPTFFLKPYTGSYPRCRKSSIRASRQGAQYLKTRVSFWPSLLPVPSSFVIVAPHSGVNRNTSRNGYLPPRFGSRLFILCYADISGKPGRRFVCLYLRGPRNARDTEETTRCCL